MTSSARKSRITPPTLRDLALSKTSLKQCGPNALGALVPRLVGHGEAAQRTERRIPDHRAADAHIGSELVCLLHAYVCTCGAASAPRRSRRPPTTSALRGCDRAVALRKSESRRTLRPEGPLLAPRSRSKAAQRSARAQKRDGVPAGANPHTHTQLRCPKGSAVQALRVNSLHGPQAGPPMPSSDPRLCGQMAIHATKVAGAQSHSCGGACEGGARGNHKARNIYAPPWELAAYSTRASLAERHRSGVLASGRVCDAARP